MAQYLVGAKLMLRFPELEIPVRGSNVGDRRSRDDERARPGDFQVRDTVIEVAAGLPDQKHLEQIAEVLEESQFEVWLLTRQDRVATWQHELQEYQGMDSRRVVVTAIESFVGQNISEMGVFSADGKETHLEELFRLYNERWIQELGTPGIRIVVR